MAQQQSLQTLKTIDVALLVVEAHQPISHQDQALANLIERSQAGAVIAVNKWDLAAAGRLPTRDITAYYRAHLPALAWAPVVTVSALTGQNVEKLLDWTVAIWERRHAAVPAEALAEFLTSAAKRQRPRGTGKGTAGQPGAERPRLHRLEQVQKNPPAFTLWIGPRQSLHTAYRRFLVRLLNDRFHLHGTNCKLYVKQLRPPHRRPR